MKKLILMVFLMTTTTTVFGYSCDQIIQKENFQLCYNYELKATLVAKSKLTAKGLWKRGFDREGIEFFKELSIPEQYRTSSRSYRGSGFDRSHLVSNAAWDHDRKLQKNTFSYANVTHHYPNFNRGVFKHLEKFTRKIIKAKKHGDYATVYTGNIFERINPKRVSVDKVAVPTHVYKVIVFPDGKVLAFLLENKAEKQSTKVGEYLVDVKEIEKLTGFKFKLS